MRYQCISESSMQEYGGFDSDMRNNPCFTEFHDFDEDKKCFKRPSLIKNAQVAMLLSIQFMKHQIQVVH